jgi:hypothetical protein
LFLFRNDKKEHNKTTFEQPSQFFMQLLNPKILLFLNVGIAILASFFAKRAGKNPYLWFFIGFLFGTLSFIALLFMSSRKTIKKPTLVVAPNEVLKELPKDCKFWYYLNHEQEEIGPISFSRLLNLYNSGKVTKLTYIWNEDFEDWKYLKDTEMYHLFSDKSAI